VNTANNCSKKVLATTGIEGLDIVLNGGLPYYHIYLLEGKSGTGKTTLAMQFLMAGVAHGERGLFVTTSETISELQQVAAFHGWSLTGIELFELNTSRDDSTATEGPYTLFYPAEVELSKSTEKILNEVERIKPMRVVIDALSGLRLLADDPLQHRRQIDELRRALINKQCTTIMVGEVSESEHNFQSRSLAHGIIHLEQIPHIYGAERRRLRIVKLRGIHTPGGYHDFQIVTGGIRVFPRLIASQYPHSSNRKPVSCGLNELDTMLNGGLNRGSSMLLMGSAGTGKSTIAMQYAFAAAQRQEHHAVYLFEEHIDTYLERATNLGIDIRTHMQAGLAHVQQVDPAEMSPSEFAHNIRDQVDHYNLRLVIIDSVNGYLNAMPEQRYLNLHMQELLSYLNRKGVITLLIIAQHGMLGPEVKTPIDLTSIMDTVILLRYFEAFGKVRQSIAVLKKRTGDHERTIRELHIGAQGIRIGKPLEDFQGVLTGTPSYLGKTDPLLGAQ
jgi:circadian clock protein KaiC